MSYNEYLDDVQKVFLKIWYLDEMKHKKKSLFNIYYQTEFNPNDILITNIAYFYGLQTLDLVEDVIFSCYGRVTIDESLKTKDLRALAMQEIYHKAYESLDDSFKSFKSLLTQDEVINKLEILTKDYNEELYKAITGG